jgi:hypothetical protein
MTHSHDTAAANHPPPKVYPFTVLLTAREITALVGPPLPPNNMGAVSAAVTFVVTSADDDQHRVNYAHAALLKFQQAVRDQRP